MEQPIESRARLHALDAFRGIAALCVVFYHAVLRYPYFMAGTATPPVALWPGFTRFDAGVIPVLWFFVISGFVITWTVDRCATPLDFIVSRFSRLYPAYWASILLAMLELTVAPLPHTAFSARTAWINTSMLQAYLYVPDIEGVYWSLAVELGFYLFALALFSAGLWRHVHVAALAWALLSLAAALLAGMGVAVPARASQLLLLHYAPLLVGGMMLYKLWRRQPATWPLATLAVCSAAIFALFSPVLSVLCLAGMGSILWAGRGGLAWLGAKPLVWLGSISYSLYLVHEYPAYIVRRAAQEAGLPVSVGVTAAVLASLVLATAISYGVERPAMRWIRAVWSERQAAA